MKEFLTGNEALARGAYEADVKFASAYPGTPSTEILENMMDYEEIMSEWAPNEKVALEAAIGASIAGIRSISTMKHVGVNVAADPLFTFSYTGVNAGMVLVAADEPGQHSSQNEQDSRNYAYAAKLAMFEPSNSQECLDMMREAYEVSEKFDTPVMMRVTTRVSHSKSTVETGARIEVEDKHYVKSPAKYLMVPALSQRRRELLEDRLQELKNYSETTSYNKIELGGEIGVVVSGMSYHYAKEVFGNNATYLKLGFTNPLPDKLLQAFSKKVDIIYVIEENDPYLENWIRSNGIMCHGKDTFPANGEMLQDVIRKAVFNEQHETISFNEELLVNRPPTLCAGCPHRGVFYELGRRKNIVVSGDIGCYTLGFAPPYNAMDTCICMGAAMSIGHGMQKAFDIKGEEKRVVGVMGDSTFFHTGINALTEVLYNNSRAITIILDNRITGMTGHQQNPGTGKLASGDPAHEMSIVDIVSGMGIKNLTVVNPNELKEVRKSLDEALSKDEPSIIITRWPCVLKKMEACESAQYGNPYTTTCEVDHSKCVGCKACIRSGCPAISMDENKRKANIDCNQCVGCTICAQICPSGSISVKGGVLTW